MSHWGKWTSPDIPSKLLPDSMEKLVSLRECFRRGTWGPAVWKYLDNARTWALNFRMYTCMYVCYSMYNTVYMYACIHIDLSSPTSPTRPKQAQLGPQPWILGTSPGIAGPPQWPWGLPRNIPRNLGHSWEPWDIPRHLGTCPGALIYPQGPWDLSRDLGTSPGTLGFLLKLKIKTPS